MSTFLSEFVLLNVFFHINPEIQTYVSLETSTHATKIGFGDFDISK